MKRLGLLLVFSAASFAANYTARAATDHGVPVIQLGDAAAGVEVTILPTVGNRVSEMKVHGKNILYFPVTDLADLKKTPGLNGLPLLAPWANRLNEEAFWANGK
jgi:aldose 1-epimerase